MSKKLFSLSGCFVNYVNNTMVVVNLIGDRKMYLWSVNKSRRLYTFETEINNHRIISKDGKYVGDLRPDRSLVVLEKTRGENFKVILTLPYVIEFCIANDQNLLSYRNGREYLLVDLLRRETIYKQTAFVHDSAWSAVSRSREFLAMHLYTDSSLWIYNMINGNVVKDRLHCDKVEFIGDTNVLYYMTQYGDLMRFDCSTGQQTIQHKSHVTDFVQSPSCEFLAVKIGYYTRVNEQKYVQFYKNGQLWTRFDEIDEIDYFLNETTLVGIDQRLDKETNNIYTTAKTGIVFQTTDGWQTCRKIAHIPSCDAVFINTDNQMCAIVDKSTQWKDELVVETIVTDR